MDSFPDLPATLFSPAKMFYIAYVVLTALKIPANPPWWEFFAVTAVFLAVEIFHNDYLRRKLNIAAEKDQLKPPISANAHLRHCRKSARLTSYVATPRRGQCGPGC